ncbi:MAG: XdhC family protein [Gammaproteobacteria bacterium]|nr:XdhC family protein [Gammaproteobacteria bacterium]
MAHHMLNLLLELHSQRRPHAVATVVEVTGSTSAKTGSKAVIDENGRVLAGWVGGGCAESMTCSQALKSIETGETAVLDIDLNSEVLGAGMPCGGSMRVYVEPVLPRAALWIMGHGRVAEALSLMGELQGLDVHMIDRLLEPEKYPNATRLITDDPQYDQLRPARDDYVVIATQHKGDHRSMTRALKSDAEYIALVASRKRSRLVLDYLRKEGFSEADLQRVRAPCGIDLGARTPEEIALCVISEIVLVRRRGSGQLMRDTLNQASDKPNSSTASVSGASCAG